MLDDERRNSFYLFIYLFVYFYFNEVEEIGLKDSKKRGKTEGEK